MATVARSFINWTGSMDPSEISWANSRLRTSHAASAWSAVTPSDIWVSDEDWLTRNTLMQLSARLVKMRLSTPMIPAMDVPDTVIRQELSMDEMPVTALASLRLCLRMTVPGAEGLKVFLTRTGMSLELTG